MLRKIDGLSQREIASRMNISESTVEKHLAKALRLLMIAVSEHEHPAQTSRETHYKRKDARKHD